jgi:putative N6-adenine-specific DNA methylase
MNHYFATVARALEPIAVQELEQLGAQNVRPAFAGVHFEGDRALLYRVNLRSRVLFRVLMPIAELKSRNANQLYQQVREIDWEEYLQPDNTLAVRCTGSNAQLNHSHFTALQIKNAIVDQQRDRHRRRSSVDIESPDLALNAHIDGDSCVLSLDSSGESLHRRGYRPAMGVAPLKETLAAALLEMAQWDVHLPLFDPLCGSGTLPLEAGLKALNIAPGLMRDRFAFENWLDFDAQLWQEIRAVAKDAQRDELPAWIGGSDRDRDILAQARVNAQKCALNRHLCFSEVELSRVEAPSDRGILICNPPYGKRIGNSQELGSLYKQLGDTCKQRFKGWKAYILTGNKELAKQIGLKASRRIPVFNGSLPCTLFEYELY